MPTKITSSERLIAEIKELEGFTPVAKHLPGDRDTVITGGYGDTNVALGQVFTEPEADALLREALRLTYEAQVNAIIHVPLTQGMFDALVSFCYNLGGHSLLTSTLRRKLNDGDYPGAAAEFSRWCQSDGQIQPGLVKRRALERSWFLETAFPASQAA